MSFEKAVELKPRQVQKMRCIGALTDREFNAINNMQGRGLRPRLGDDRIYFGDAKNRPVAAVHRSEDKAVVYQSTCTPEELRRYGLGLQSAGYDQIQGFARTETH